MRTSKEWAKYGQENGLGFVASDVLNQFALEIQKDMHKCVRDVLLRKGRKRERELIERTICL